MLSPVVSLHPYFFLRALLLLAGDVEANPGPIQGKEMQYLVSIVTAHLYIFHNTNMQHVCMCGGSMSVGVGV